MKPLRATWLLFMLLLASPVSSQEISGTPDEGAVVMEDGSELWFVEMQSLPTTDGGDLNTILAEQATFRAVAAQLGVRYRERNAHQTLWNGLSIELVPEDIGKVRGIPGVTLYPIFSVQLPDPEPVVEPALATALAMTGADVAQNELGLTGAGIKVGIIDSGIDYDHADLGGDGVARAESHMFPNARVVAGYDFVGQTFNGISGIAPDPYPDDCDGHGTHVAGIVGANGSVKGVAPGVLFGAYKAFSCSGNGTVDLVLLAMERALADGMQIVNMSLGYSGKEPLASAADRLVRQGVVVVAAMGNNGPGGHGESCCLYNGLSPSVASNVISVGSFDNTWIEQRAVAVSPDGRLVPLYKSACSWLPPESGTFPIRRTGTPSSPADACSALPPGSLNGQVALIRRGTCSAYQKAMNAFRAGAIGVIIYNNVESTWYYPDVCGSPAVPSIVLGVTKADGLLLNDRIAAGPTTITCTPGVYMPNATGGFVSPFSTYGLTADLKLKPDLGAPGGFINYTYPLDLVSSGYLTLSGTSMASPHVAGAVALLLEARPNTPPSAVGDILTNSAVPRPRPASGDQLDMVSVQGAGLLDIASAVRATTRVEPGQLALGETEGGSVTGSFEITNDSPGTVTYTLSHEPALASGPNTFLIASVVAPSTVGFSTNPVSVPPGGSATVEVTITPDPALSDRSLFGGYILVSPDDDGQSVRVSYAGFKGDYQSIPVLVPGVNNFPWLARRQPNGSYINQPNGATFNMQGQFGSPFIAYHLDHPASILRMEVFDALTGAAWHRFVEARDVSRNAAPNGFSVARWDGITYNGGQYQLVPNGQYVVKLSVKKALGDDDNPAHWESWTSPVITIARPDLAVGALALSQNSVQAGDEVAVSAEVRNLGGVDEQGIGVEFLDNGSSLGTFTIDLAAGEKRTLETAWSVGSEIQHRLQARVTPLGFEDNYGNNETALDVSLGQPIVGVNDAASRVLALAPGRPNPFNGSVAFQFSLPQRGPVNLEVFDLAGRRLKSWRWGALEVGEHTVNWDGRTELGGAAPAGALLLRLSAMDRVLTRKVLRLP